MTPEKTKRKAQSLMENVTKLQLEGENLKNGLYNSRVGIATKIAFSFLVSGVTFLVLSVILDSSILALIGLGLTFWGALFLFIKPMQFVRSTILGSTMSSFYLTVDRILKDMRYSGAAFYIPPFLAQVELPAYLKGLKDVTVFISAEENTQLPSIEELAKRKFLLKRPKGIILVPPGFGLASLFEKESKINFSSDLESFFAEFLRVMVEDFQLAREISFEFVDDTIRFSIFDSVYKEVFFESGLKSLYKLGDPLTSAIAILLAKFTGKIVTLSSYFIHEEGRIVQVTISFVEVE